MTSTILTSNAVRGQLNVARRYTRSDARGRFPVLAGLSDLDYNRIAMAWRPVIDMTDSDSVALRLRFVQHISAMLAEPDRTPQHWFAIIGVSGLRRQVLRHAGLEHYEAEDPTKLAPELRTEQWSRLVRAIERYETLDDATRTLIIFQLAQLSYCELVRQLAGVVLPNGDPIHDRYAYEVARVHARVPGGVHEALEVFERLATGSTDLRLALAACAQGMGHSIRNGIDPEVAITFEGYGQRIVAAGLDEDWHTRLVRSRYHRAVALVRLVQRRADDMRGEVDEAVRYSDLLFAAEPTGTDRLVALENKRILLESQIKAAARARGDESAEQVRALCDELYSIDPYCVEVRLVLGDGYAANGNHAEAARWYSRAGELGTGAGAIGWYRAGQCFDHIGDRAAALNAMGRCLELDNAAVEPRAFLTEHKGTH